MGVNVKTVGLVGQSGTGKSMIAAHLVDKGAGHIDADEVAHMVLRTNDAARKRIRKRFGPEVFIGKDIDRRALGRVVFGDPEALKELNGIVHPAIIEACVERLDEFKSAGVELVVIDAALLLEVPLPFEVDLMIALRCDREEQVRRLVAVGGVEKDIEARLDSQDHLEEAFDRADVVIDTRKPKKAVLSEIDGIIKVLLDHRLN